MAVELVVAVYQGSGSNVRGGHRSGQPGNVMNFDTCQ